MNGAAGRAHACASVPEDPVAADPDS